MNWRLNGGYWSRRNAGSRRGGYRDFGCFGYRSGSYYGCLGYLGGGSYRGSLLTHFGRGRGSAQVRSRLRKEGIIGPAARAKGECTSQYHREAA